MRRVFANVSLDSLMSNSNAEPSRVPNDSPSGTEKLHTGIERPDDSVRDFFRRGDRGQYEGGPAEHVHSIHAMDLPEKPQIVRTPKQEARRRALIRIEAVLLTGCLALLVVAARAKSTAATEPSRASGAQLDARIVEPSAPKAPVAVQQEAARPEAAPPPPKTVNEPMLNAQAPVAAVAAEPPPPPPKAANEPALNSQAPEARAASEPAKASRAEDAAKFAPAAPEKAASTQTAKRTQPRQASARSVAAAPARPTLAPRAEPVYAPPVAAPAQNPPAPKRAVAAFPVD